MTKLGDVLFPPADERRTTMSLLSWWESRRLTYNVVVGLTGAFTLVATNLVALIPPGFKLAVPPQAILAYALLANVCYTFGWALEATAQRLWGERTPRFGPALFRQGLAFSVGLTLLPVLIASLSWFVRVIMVVAHRP